MSKMGVLGWAYTVMHLWFPAAVWSLLQVLFVVCSRNISSRLFWDCDCDLYGYARLFVGLWFLDSHLSRTSRVRDKYRVGSLIQISCGRSLVGVMFSLQKWKCSWSLAATIAAILAVVSVVHLFLYPLVPPLDYLSISQAQSACLPINGSTNGGEKYVSGTESKERLTDNSNEDPHPVVDLNVQYPADSHNAVTYSGAPWRAEIGRWLSGCDSNVKAVQVVEVLKFVTITIWYTFSILVVITRLVINYLITSNLVENSKKYAPFNLLNLLEQFNVQLY